MTELEWEKYVSKLAKKIGGIAFEHVEQNLDGSFVWTSVVKKRKRLNKTQIKEAPTKSKYVETRPTPKIDYVVKTYTFNGKSYRKRWVSGGL